MSKTPPVSDHAVLRYLERISGVDVEGIRQRIWAQTRSAVGMQAKKTTVGGITFVIRNGHVITVLSAAAHPEPEPLDNA
jgi:hypothetical protein